MTAPENVPATDACPIHPCGGHPIHRYANAEAYLTAVLNDAERRVGSSYMLSVEGIYHLRAAFRAEREARESAEAMIPRLLDGDCSESQADEHPDNHCWAHERNVWNCVAALIAERATLRRERDEAVAHCSAISAMLATVERERDEWSLALQSLTPGGSEYVDDPARCVAFVREARESERRMATRAIRERDEALSNLELAARELRDCERERDEMRAFADDVQSIANVHGEDCEQALRNCTIIADLDEVISRLRGEGKGE